MLTVTVDGNVAYCANANAALKPGNISATVGIHHADRPSGPLTTLIDDVAIYVTGM